MRRASIKETGEEISEAEWARFDAAVARAKAERSVNEPSQAELALDDERLRATAAAGAPRQAAR